MSSDPHNPAASAPNAVLGGAALAVGALIAGVAIGRRSRWGLAFGLGVAAMAGYQLLKQRRQSEGKETSLSTRELASSAKTVPLPAVPVETAPAVPLVVEKAAEADVRPEVETAGHLEFSPAPLLPTQALVIAEEVAAPSSLVPLIWEGGDSGSRSSDGVGETVWFGLQDVALAQVEQMAASPSSLIETAKPVPQGEVAMEGDVASLASAFVADFPPAPQLESLAPALSPDFAALIQALNPPPLSSGAFTADAPYLGTVALMPAASYDGEDASADGDAGSFLLEDDGAGKAGHKGSSLAVVALVLLSVLGLGVGWM